MNGVIFKKIRKKLGLTQAELGKLLKEQTGKGSLSLVREIEVGNLEVQKYIADTMMLLGNVGIAESCQENTSSVEQFRLDAAECVNALCDLLEAETAEQKEAFQDYEKELRGRTKECVEYLSKSIDLLN